MSHSVVSKCTVWVKNTVTARRLGVEHRDGCLRRLRHRDVSPLSVRWHAAGPALEMAFNRGIEKPPHRVRSLERIDCSAVDVAVVIVSFFELYDHVAVGSVITDAPDEAAAIHCAARERRKLDGTAILYVHSLRPALADNTDY